MQCLTRIHGSQKQHFKRKEGRKKENENKNAVTIKLTSLFLVLRKPKFGMLLAFTLQQVARFGFAPNYVPVWVIEFCCSKFLLQFQLDAII